MDDDVVVETAVDLACQLCALPSVSAHADGLDETAHGVERMLAESGFETRLLRSGGSAPAVWGQLQGRSPYTLLLYNHYDVQPVDPLAEWVTPPFSPDIRNGRLFARGAADNKGQIATRLAVVRAIRDEQGQVPFTLRWIIEGEEEVGSTHFASIAREHADLLRADAALWEGSAPDVGGRPEISIGFKGVLAFRLDVRTMLTDAHSGSAGVLPSAAWRLMEALEIIRGDAPGSPGWSGFHGGVRPQTPAAREALDDHGDAGERELADAYGVERFVDGISGRAFRERLSFEPSLNIAGIHTGYSGPGMKTITPAEASAWLDFRLVPDQHPDEILAALRRRLGEAGCGDVELTVLAAAPPSGIAIAHPLVRRVASIAADVAGAPPLIHPMYPGSLPLLSAMDEYVGVPGLSAPDNPVYTGCCFHAPNEHIRLEDVALAVRFTRRLLEDLCTPGEADAPPA
jgi:acetylornithine deacetylase/succinyl-diaminopimelate desuccinylase-like protein